MFAVDGLSDFLVMDMYDAFVWEREKIMGWNREEGIVAAIGVGKLT